MKFDPTFDYGDTDLSIDENLVFWKFGELLKTLITLSSDANRQKEIIGIGATADEMAEDFYTYFTLSYQSYVDNNLISFEQQDKLFELDKFFNERTVDT